MVERQAVGTILALGIGPCISAAFIANLPIVFHPGWMFRITTLLTLTTGTTMLMLISDQIGALLTIPPSAPARG